MHKEFYWESFPAGLFPLPFITFPFKPFRETVPWSVFQNEHSLSHDGKGMSCSLT